MRWASIGICTLVACTGHQPSQGAGSAAPAQSYAAAMQIMCEASSPISAADVRAKVANPEIIELFDAIRDAAPDVRGRELYAAATKAALTHCALLESTTAMAYWHAPRLAAAPTARGIAPKQELVLTADTAVIVEGKAIVSIENGRAAPDEIDRGGLVHLRTFLTALAAEATKRGPLPPLLLVIAPRLPILLVTQLATSASDAGFAQLAFGVAIGRDYKAISFATARTAPAGARIHLHGDAVSLAVTGHEQTVTLAELAAAIPAGAAPVAVDGDAATTMQTLANVLAVIPSAVVVAM